VRSRRSRPESPGDGGGGKRGSGGGGGVGGSGMGKNARRFGMRFGLGHSFRPNFGLPGLGSKFPLGPKPKFWRKTQNVSVRRVGVGSIRRRLVVASHW